MHLNKELNTFDSHAFLIVWKANDWMNLSCSLTDNNSKGPTKPDSIRPTWLERTDFHRLFLDPLCLCLYFLLYLCFSLCLCISNCLYLFPSFFLFSLFTHTYTHHTDTHKSQVLAAFECFLCLIFDI